MVDDLVSDDPRTTEGVYSTRMPTPPSYSFEDPILDLRPFAGEDEMPSEPYYGSADPSSMAYVDSPYIARGTMFFGGHR